ncbi:MAG TPA: glycosyltransferase [Nitrospira sp.]|nr:glycosyltransferase [Nitrospira sp.]
MRFGLINSPSLSERPVSRSMAGGLGFDGSEAMILPPLDLAIMAATLRQAGETVEIIDADPLRLDAAGVHERLGQERWNMLIVTASLPSLDHDAAFIAELRRRHPRAKIVAKTLVRDHGVLRRLLERSGADFVIHGEADLTISDIAHGRTRRGTAWLEPDSTGASLLFRFEEGDQVKDLNQLPFPARDLLPNDRYVYPLLGAPVVTLQTSRGCPFPCGYYCPYPLVEGVKWRAQTAERIFAELKDVVEGRGLTKIYFRDATFTLNQDRVAKLCDLMSAAGWSIEWVCETRIDCLGDPLLEKMRRAGCVGILVGVETGDERVMHLPEGKKGLTIPKLAHLREKTRQLGIRLHFLLIVGLPQETRESLVATYDLIQRYKPDTIGVTIITPYPGTPLYEQGLREGWIDSREWKDYGGHQVPMHTPNLTKADMETGKRLLEDGFALLQRRQVGGHSAPLEALAKTHYEHLLRWAYRLEEPIAQLRKSISGGTEPRMPIDSAPQSPVTAASRETKRGEAPLPLSVVIPTYNRRAILRKTLLAFASQTAKADQFEILVVDDGSSDDTIQMLERFNAPFALRIFHQRHQGANAARNLAIREAKGSLVLLTGDDMIPEPAFIEAHVKFHLQHPSETEAMLGFIDWSPEISVTPFMRYLVAPEGGQQFAFHLAQDGYADFKLFYTSNISLKRAFLCRQPTIFDTDFTYPAYDDTELGYRLSKQGLRIHYNPKAVTSHHHEMTLQGFAQRQRKAGHMALVLTGKHPELAQTMNLGIDEIMRSKSSYTEQRIDALLAVLSEVEKPSLETLNRVHVNGKGYDHFYTRNVLYPLYHSLLHTAYALGLCEAMSNSSGKEQESSSRTYVASIVIPVWNKMELTAQCLTRLAEVTKDVDYEVIIVDNHSTDGTAEFLRRIGGDVRVISNRENVGFAKACNQGARMAKGRYLVFLNNDTIPLPGWLDALVAEAEAHREVGIVGSKLLYADGTIQHAGVLFMRNGLGPYHRYRLAPADLPAVNRRCELQAVTGACLLIRSSLFHDVGGFDEAFRNGFEDVDLCLKIKQTGHLVVYQPRSLLYHLESQTPGRKLYDEVNAELLRNRWKDHWWIADEDVHYFADGYKLVTKEQNGAVRQQVAPLNDSRERAAWGHVAAAQAAGLKQDWTTMRRELRLADDWPSEPYLLAWGATVCEKLSEPAMAEAFLSRYLDLMDDPAVRLKLARILLDHQNFDAAGEHIQRLLSAHPSHPEGLLLKGILCMQRAQYREAGMAFTSALQQGAERRKCLMGTGMASLGLGSAEDGWERFVEVLSEYPDDAEAIHWLLRAGTSQHRWVELSRHLRSYVMRNPGDLSVRFALAGVLFRADRIEEARQEYDRLRTLSPNYDGLTELGRLLENNEAMLASEPSVCGDVS